MYIDPYANKPFTEVPFLNQTIAPVKNFEPKIDALVSKIVGQKILQQDPRLIRLVVTWKGNKPENSMQQDNLFQNPKFIAELKEVLSQPL